MGRLPAFQFYPGDWLRDNVAGCSLAAQGLWLRMMIVAHDSEPYGHLPYSDAMIARRCGCSLEEYETLTAELFAAGVPSRTTDGVIYSRRMVRDDEERRKTKKRVEKFRKNKAKSDSETVENSDCLQQDTSCNAQVTPEKRDGNSALHLHSSSSSSSSSISKDISEEFDLLRKSAQSDENHHSGPAVSKCPKVEKGECPGAFHERYMAWATEQVNAFVGNGNAEQLAIAYPGVSLGQEAARALVWLQANPGKRKKDIARFMNNWLARGQERQPAAQPGTGAGQAGPRKTLDQMIAESRERDRINADIRKN